MAFVANCSPFIAKFSLSIVSLSIFAVWHIPRILDEGVFVLQIQVEPTVNEQNQILTNYYDLFKRKIANLNFAFF